MRIMFFAVLVGLLVKDLLLNDWVRGWVDSASLRARSAALSYCPPVHPLLVEMNSRLNHCTGKQPADCAPNRMSFVVTMIRFFQERCETDLVSWQFCREAAALTDYPDAIQETADRCKLGVLGACVIGIWHRWGAGDRKGAQAAAKDVCKKGSKNACIAYGWIVKANGGSERFSESCSAKDIQACLYAAGAARFRGKPEEVRKYAKAICQLGDREVCEAMKSPNGSVGQL